jgi:hypothetical protein
VNKLNRGFLLDVLHAHVHFQGFRNRLASFWTELVVTKAAKRYQPAHKANKQSVIHAGYVSGM